MVGRLLPSACAIAAVIAIGGTALSQEGKGGKGEDEVFQKTRTVTITGTGISGNPLIAFDISWFDRDLNRYYLADRSNKAVDVIIPPSTVLDKQFQPGFVGALSSNDISGPDGVLTLSNNGVKQLWVGDGMSRVWVLDPTTGAVLTPPVGGANPIPTSSGPTIVIQNNPNRADELCFDSADNLVMVANNADNPPFASIISIETFKVVAQIAFNGTNNAPNSNNGAEQCQWSPRTGKFYISIPGIVGHPAGEGGVAVIDPKTKMVVKTFIIPVDDCAAPSGMAVGPDKQILEGCQGQSPNGHFNTVIINENTGSIIGKLTDQGGDDEVWFNPGDGHYFGAGGFSLPTERLNIIDSAGKRPDQFVMTGTNCGTTRRAHSVAADPVTNEVYVPIPPDTGTPPVPPAPVCAATTAPYFESDVCPDPTKGCVAVFAPVGRDDHPRTVQQRQSDDHQE
jgi:hypothetical protein